MIVVAFFLSFFLSVFLPSLLRMHVHFLLPVVPVGAQRRKERKEAKNYRQAYNGIVQQLLTLASEYSAHFVRRRGDNNNDVNNKERIHSLYFFFCYYIQNNNLLYIGPRQANNMICLPLSRLDESQILQFSNRPDESRSTFNTMSIQENKVC